VTLGQTIRERLLHRRTLHLIGKIDPVRNVTIDVRQRSNLAGSLAENWRGRTSNRIVSAHYNMILFPFVDSDGSLLDPGEHAERRLQ
jgi:hypothetical protein